MPHLLYSGLVRSAHELALAGMRSLEAYDVCPKYLQNMSSVINLLELTPRL